MAVPRAGKALSHRHCAFFCFLITPFRITVLLVIIIWVTQQSDAIKQWKRKMTFKYQCFGREDTDWRERTRGWAARFAAEDWRDQQGLQGYQEVCGCYLWGSGSLYNTCVVLFLLCLLFLVVHRLSDMRIWTSARIRENLEGRGTPAFTAVSSWPFAVVGLYP